MEEDYIRPATKTKERVSLYKNEPVLLKDVEIEEESRLKTDISELDRVLGGE